MDSQNGPLFALHLIWHPLYSGGQEIANYLRIHYSRDLYKIVGEEHGVDVLERSDPVSDAPTPLPIDWDNAEFTAIVALTESMMVNDHEWVNYIRDIAQEAQARGHSVGFFPVTMDSRGVEMEVDQQALRWDIWKTTEADRNRRLTSGLTHEFCRMLRHHLDELRSPAGEEVSFQRYLEKIQIFISHSKHDNDGELLAGNIRDWIHKYSPLASFFDVHDIPAGQPFHNVILDQIDAGAVIAVHTDSYSSRKWCRREVIEAKRRQVPMIVVDCVRDTDPRGIPYLGNVPIIRMEPNEKGRVGEVEGCILDEIFRTWLWLCRVGQHLVDSPSVLFTARPPELILLAALPLGSDELNRIIVYPEPLMGADEERLFMEIVPSVRVQTLTEWLEER